MRRVGGRHWHTMREIGHLDEVAFLHVLNVIHRHPRALVIAGSDLVIWTDADAIRRAHAGGEDFELLPTAGDLEHAAVVVAQRTPAAAAGIHRAALDEIEIALRVRLETEGELVESRRDLHVVVEALV